MNKNKTLNGRCLKCNNKFINTCKGNDHYLVLEKNTIFYKISYSFIKDNSLYLFNSLYFDSHLNDTQFYFIDDIDLKLYKKYGINEEWVNNKYQYYSTQLDDIDNLLNNADSLESLMIRIKQNLIFG